MEGNMVAKIKKYTFQVAGEPKRMGFVLKPETQKKLAMLQVMLECEDMEIIEQAINELYQKSFNDVNDADMSVIYKVLEFKREGEDLFDQICKRLGIKDDQGKTTDIKKVTLKIKEYQGE